MTIEEKQEKLDELKNKYKVTIKGANKIIKNKDFEEVIIPFYNWLAKSKLFNNTINIMKKQIYTYYDDIVIRIDGMVESIKLPGNLKNIKIPEYIAAYVEVQNIKSICNINEFLYHVDYDIVRHKDFLIIEKMQLSYLNRLINYMKSHNMKQECTRKNIYTLWNKFRRVGFKVEDHLTFLDLPRIQSIKTISEIKRLTTEIDDELQNSEAIEAVLKGLIDFESIEKKLQALQLLLEYAIKFLEKQGKIKEKS